MKGQVVTLEWFELYVAAMVGIRRRLESLRKGIPNQHGFDGENDWTIDIEGAGGEMAAAKILNLYYSATINTFKVGGDIGNLQVRTGSKDHHSLIIRSRDRDEDVFVLVVGKAPRYHVVGWIEGRKAKNSEWIKNPGNRPQAWFVPQSELRPIEQLISLMKEAA
jgi:hypothetical protein